MLSIVFKVKQGLLTWTLLNSGTKLSSRFYFTLVNQWDTMCDTVV